eukprot:9297449-Alexandrium_andersonii.AAC.1
MGGGGEAADAAADAALLRPRRLRSLRFGLERARTPLAGRQRPPRRPSAQRMPTVPSGPHGWQRCSWACPSPWAWWSAWGLRGSARVAARSRRQAEWCRWVEESLANGQGRLSRWI